MTNLLTPRDHYKPFEYPWAFEYYKKQQQARWVPEEVPLHEDVRDWNNRLTDSEKNFITQIFRFFTQADCDVAAGYYDKFIPIFRKPELRMMMGEFASVEGLHQEAYSLLLDTIGMPETEYKAFMDYKVMADKHEYVSNFSVQHGDYDADGDLNIEGGVKDLAKALAVYSAFTEGLQLFSSFVMLLNFTRFGKMKGMGQIITWSIRDESIHVEAMTKLFRTLIAENLEVWTDDFKGELYAISRRMVSLEDKFIDMAFDMGPMEGLTPDEVKQYIRYIADRRNKDLGLKPEYNVENPLGWFEEMLGASEHANFFETRSTEYSKGATTGEWGF